MWLFKTVRRTRASSLRPHFTVILLTGGTKKRQQRDIETAAMLWRDYKRTKRSARE